MKILIAEDEKKLASFISKGLQQVGYIVQQCHSGSDALNKAANDDFDLILLDLMLPGVNGFEVLKNLRAFKISTPVIIVSALGNTEQVVEGLDLGAVDYIKKPFEWNEVLARIRAVQRKASATETMKMTIDSLVIDAAARKVTREGIDIQLTAKEFLLLQYLAKNVNRVVTRVQLLENVWEIDFDPESNIIDVYLYQLRKKLDKRFSEPMIETIIGAGYKLKGTKQV